MASRGSDARKRSDERGRSPARTGERRLRLKSRGEGDEIWLREIRQGRETARALFSSTSSTAVHVELHQEYKNKNMLRASAEKGPLVVRASLELKSCLTRMFLPEGYPHSVSRDYLPYQIWDTIQAFCSTVTGMLAAKAMLTGIGVGSNTATVGAALWQTTVRRNIGKVARIFFVTFKGTDLDENAKSWRIVADVLNDFALAVELISPALCPAVGDCHAEWSYFAAISLAETCRAVVGVAGGATRAALTQHFALRDNYGDVNAKDGSQEVLVEILGSCVGMFVVQTCVTKVAAWAAFCILTCCHIMANIMACRAVQLSTFNRQRAQIVAAAWMQDGRVLTPSQVAVLESPWYFGGSGVSGYSITMGSSVAQLSEALGDRLADEILRTRAHQREYIVAVSQGEGEVVAGIRQGASLRDILCCYMHAFLTARTHSFSTVRLQHVQRVLQSTDVCSSDIQESGDVWDMDTLPTLLEKLEEQGWRLDSVHVSLSGTFLEW